MQETRLHEKVEILADCIQKLHEGCLLILQMSEVMSQRITMLEQRVKQLEDIQMMEMGRKH